MPDPLIHRSTSARENSIVWDEESPIAGEFETRLGNVRIRHGRFTGGLSDQERETLEEICELEPGPCRLACMVRIKGPVEVEIVDK